jgi:hypothetical protein
LYVFGGELAPGLVWKILLTCVSAFVIFAAVVCTALTALIMGYAHKLAKHSWDIPIGVVVASSTQKVSKNATIVHSPRLLLG